MRLRSAPVIAITLVTATTVVLGFAPANDQRHAEPAAPPIGLGDGGPLEGGTGACCGIEGICVVTTAVVCGNVGGSYQGDGTVCNPDCLMTIATGPSAAATGYLAVSPDPYGAWRPDGTSVPTDETYVFNVSPAMTAAFTTGTYFFSGGTARELLSTDNLGGAIPDDASMTKMVTAGLVLSDTSGDSVNDTATSSFSLTGVAGDLDIDLLQHVQIGPGSRSVLTQEYTITNNLQTSIDFTLVRVYDGDLLWDAAADFADDELLTVTNMLPPGLGSSEQWVAMRDMVAVGGTVFVGLASLDGSAYVGGKRGVDPDGPGGSPPYNYGTAPEYWDAYGVPTGWRNHIAGVGYNTDGLSGPAPPGSTPPEDAHMALEIPVSLAGNATTTVSMLTYYGQPTPPRGACCEGTGCSIDDADFCAFSGGTFQGYLTTCPDACPAPNDECAGKTEIDRLDASGTTEIPFDLAGATASPEPSGCVGGSHKDIWYCLTNDTAVTKFVHIDTTGPTVTLEFYVGCGCPPGPAVTCSTVGNNLILDPGEQYKIRLIDHLDQSGSGSLVIENTPLGACCDTPEPPCEELTASTCQALGGVYQGDGTTCAAGACGTCPWDCDGSGNGYSNVVDLLTLLSQYDITAPVGCTGGSCDFDGNGCVDVGDLLKLLANYSISGTTCGPS